MEYKQFFSPSTLEKLDKQSKENLKQMLGGKSLNQAIISSVKLLSEISKAEAPYKDKLERLAIEIVEELYPIIEQEGIIIDAKIVSMSGVGNTLEEIKINQPNRISGYQYNQINPSVSGKNYKVTMDDGDVFTLHRFSKYYLLYPAFNVGSPKYDKIVDFLNQKHVPYEEYDVKPTNQYTSRKKGIKIPLISIGIKNLDESISPESRRRIINGITHGAAVRGAFAFYLFKEHLDEIDPSLVEKYNEILKLSFGIYDDDNAIALLLAMISQAGSVAGGSSKVIINESQSSKITIQARAINFPMLVHEIVKGLFELVSLQGFKGDKQQNQQVVDKVDILKNEPYDLKYGKFIYDALRNAAQLFNKDPKIIPYFFAEVYKLDNDAFQEYIENAINEQLTNQQKNWTRNIINDIVYDLNADAMGLDEIKINKPNQKINLKKQDSIYYMEYYNNPFLKSFYNDENDFITVYFSKENSDEYIADIDHIDIERFLEMLNDLRIKYKLDDYLLRINQQYMNIINSDNSLDEYSYDFEDDEYGEVEYNLSNEPDNNDKSIKIKSKNKLLTPDQLDIIAKSFKNRLNESKSIKIYKRF